MSKQLAYNLDDDSRCCTETGIFSVRVSRTGFGNMGGSSNSVSGCKPERGPGSSRASLNRRLNGTSSTFAAQSFDEAGCEFDRDHSEHCGSGPPKFHGRLKSSGAKAGKVQHSGRPHCRHSKAEVEQELTKGRRRWARVQSIPVVTVPWT